MDLTHFDLAVIVLPFQLLNNLDLVRMQSNLWNRQGTDILFCYCSSNWNYLTLCKCIMESILVPFTPPQIKVFWIVAYSIWTTSSLSYGGHRRRCSYQMHAGAHRLSRIIVVVWPQWNYSPDLHFNHMQFDFEILGLISLALVNKLNAGWRQVGVS